MTRKNLLRTVIIGPLVSLSLLTTFSVAHAQSYYQDDDSDGPSLLSSRDVPLAVDHFEKIQDMLKRFSTTGVELDKLIEAPILFDKSNDARHPDIVELIGATSATNPNPDTAQYSVVRQRSYGGLDSMEVWNVVNEKGSDGQIHQIAKLNLAQSNMMDAPLSDIVSKDIKGWYVRYQAGREVPNATGALAIMSHIRFNDFVSRDPSTLPVAQVITQYVRPGAHGEIMNTILGHFYNASCNSPVIQQELGANGPYAHGARQVKFQCRNGTVSFTDQGQTVLSLEGDQQQAAPARPQTSGKPVARGHTP